LRSFHIARALLLPSRSSGTAAANKRNIAATGPNKRDALGSKEMTMFARVIASLAAAVFLCTSALAQDERTSLQLVPRGEQAPAGGPAIKDIKPLTVNCYTNVVTCAGRAYFKNQDASRYVAIRILYNNGAGGQWNFVLPPGQDHWVNARYNDTYQFEWGTNPVPDGNPRYYIYVCCN
jgi:hypothetical protein